MKELSLEECIERFSAGGEWRPRQIVTMLGWTKSMLYRYISEGKIPKDAVIKRSIRGIRIRGEALAEFLRQLNNDNF